jgi:hypothetical protein
MQLLTLITGFKTRGNMAVYMIKLLPSNKSKTVQIHIMIWKIKILVICKLKNVRIPFGTNGHYSDLLKHA